MNNMRNKILSLLVLLLTAASGAWAEEVTVTFTQADLNCTGTVAKDGVTLTPSTGDAHSYTNLYDFGSTTFSVDKGKFTKIEIVDCSYGSISGWQTEQTGSYQPEPVDAPDYWVNLYTLTWTGEAESVTFKASVFEIQRIVFTINKPDVDVTLNEAKTEASFEMQTFDVDVNYELVRDMGYKVAFSGVPTRARLAKDGDGKFHFADGLTFQLLDNIDAANPKDITSAEGITFMVGEVEAVDFEGNTFYQLNKATLVPLADFLADAHLGNYAICAVASTGEYDGSFSSGMITLFQGYEVEVAAKEFITYYKDEPLYVEDEAAELYTIESVNGDQAVLSDRSDAMPSNTPMLVYNKSNETKVILLIPCAEPDLAITVAPEFQGTLTGTTIAASTEGQTNYAFNGKAFVFVKNAIEVGPNKAWLSVNTGVPSARITLVFDDETTKIANTNITNITNGKWYDLNGRKLDKMPTKKGVYLFNGRKVVVK